MADALVIIPAVLMGIIIGLIELIFVHADERGLPHQPLSDPCCPIDDAVHLAIDSLYFFSCNAAISSRGSQVDTFRGHIQRPHRNTDRSFSRRHRSRMDHCIIPSWLYLVAFIRDSDSGEFVASK